MTHLNICCLAAIWNANESICGVPTSSTCHVQAPPTGSGAEWMVNYILRLGSNKHSGKKRNNVISCIKPKMNVVIMKGNITTAQEPFLPTPKPPKISNKKQKPPSAPLVSWDFRLLLEKKFIPSPKLNPYASSRLDISYNPSGQCWDFGVKR